MSYSRFILTLVQCLPLLLSLLLLAAGCSSSSSTTETTTMTFPATEAGVPVGNVIGKEIGPEGGTLDSADGRLTLRVPQNALTERISFSIQPITNVSVNGIGSAYRLMPDGAFFGTPLELTVRYTEADREGTAPEALSMAYQAKDGAWHIVPPVNRTNEALTVAVTHFTDWSFLAKLRLSPSKATVRVGETVKIEVIGCAVRPSPWYVRLLGGNPPYACYLGEGIQDIGFNWSTDIGTVAPLTANPVVYTAPAKKPSPNVATVKMPYETFAWEESTFSKTFYKTGLLISKITIIDRGYKAYAKKGDVVLTGTICDLDKPFILNVAWLTAYEMKMDPAAGTWAFGTSYGPISYSGSGTFKPEGLDTDHPTLAVFGTETATTPYGGKTTSGGDNSVKLTPLETDECK